MGEILLYVAGGGLVAIALIASLAGMRSESFPSSAALRGMVAFTAVLVVATATGAVIVAREEQQHRREELNREAAEEAEAEDVAEQETEGDPDVGEEGAGEAETAAVDGEVVFTEVGCGSCHALAAAGSSGQIGPDLDDALAGKSPGYIETAIVEPQAEITEGFPENVMPTTYGQDLSPEELDALVAYLSESTSG